MMSNTEARHAMAVTQNKICSLCGGNKTYVDNNGYESWYNSKWGIICKRCFERTPERRKYMKQIHSQPTDILNRKKYDSTRIRTPKQQELKTINDKKSSKRAITSLKTIVIDHYSNHMNKCTCCGESNLMFLTIDHTNNDGANHRKVIGVTGLGFYRWLVKNNFPEGFGVMCMNCNFGKYLNGGVCPHDE